MEDLLGPFLAKELTQSLLMFLQGLQEPWGDRLTEKGTDNGGHNLGNT